MFDTVLLPIDLNHPESWEKALPMARALGGTVHVLGVVHDLGAAIVASYLPDGFEEQALLRAKADLDAFVAANVPGGVAHVAHGHVAEKVLSAAEDVGADVIVIAGHAPNDLRTFLIGSNADKVVRHATRPVLVVK